jgi:hypothetical protein
MNGDFNLRQAMTNLYSVLEQLKIRKAMFLGNNYNFASLDSFISGFVGAASHTQLQLNNYPNFTYFSTWLLGHLEKNFGLDGGWHWQLANRNPNDDEMAFNEFFHFLDVFKNSKVHSKSIVLDSDAIDFNKSNGKKRSVMLDGKEVEANETPCKIVWTNIDNSTTVWLNYLDKSEITLYHSCCINPNAAMDELKAEFGEVKNEWTEIRNNSHHNICNGNI